MNVKLDTTEEKYTSPEDNAATQREGADIDMLVEKAVDGDVQAFAEIAESYLDRIYRYVFYQVRDEKSAEELTQEIFSKAYAAIGSYADSGGLLSTWLYRVAHDHIMGDQRFTSFIPFAEKQVVILRFIEGLDKGTIEEITGENQASISTNQMHALIKLARLEASYIGEEDDGLYQELDRHLNQLSPGKLSAYLLAEYPGLSQQLKPLMDIALAIMSSPKASPSSNFRRIFRLDLIARLRKKHVKVKTVRSPDSARQRTQQLPIWRLLKGIGTVIIVPVARKLRSIFQRGIQSIRGRAGRGETSSAPNPIVAYWYRITQRIRVSRPVVISVALVLIVGIAGVLLLTGVLGLPSLFSSDKSAGTLSIHIGSAQIQAAGSESWQVAEEGVTILVNTRLRTVANSQVTLTFTDGSTIKLEPNTDINIVQADYVEEGPVEIILEQNAGKTHSKVVKQTDPGSRYEVQTPSAYVKVTGTAFIVDVDQTGNTMVKVNEGTVVVGAQDVEIPVSAGHQAQVKIGQAPTELSLPDTTAVTTKKLKVNSTTGGLVTKPQKATTSHEVGTVVNLLAEPNDGYIFVNWTGDVDTIVNTEEASTPITMNGDYSITANFIEVYKLKVNSNGGGLVTKPEDTTAYHTKGTVVNLLAEPNNGYAFSKWTGDVDELENPNKANTTVTMKGDYTIAANFIRVYKLNIASTKGGSVIQPPEGAYTYKEGTKVELLALANEGYTFVSWTGLITDITNPTSARTTIKMYRNCNITANFVKTYTVTISTSGGSIIKPGEATHTCAAGTILELVAVPNDGYAFVNWTGDTATIADVNAASTTIKVNGNYAITANFVRVYDLKVTSTVGGSVIKPGEDTFVYEEGTKVELLAAAINGYMFVNWTGDTSEIVDPDDASTFIVMNKDSTITANFIKTYKMYTLEIDSTSGGSVTQPGEGVYMCKEGTVVNLLTQADEDYAFVRWTGDVATIADINDASTTIKMNGNYSITATFAPAYTLTVQTSIGGSVVEPGEVTYTYVAGTVVDLYAEPVSGYTFVNWTGDIATIADPNSASTTITMNGDYTITANFARLYTITISSTTGGSVTQPGEGSYVYKEGTVVDLLAVTNAGYTFVNWTGDVATIADTNAVSTTITVNGDYSITANFAAAGIQHSLTVSSTAGGTVTQPGEGSFNFIEGTTINLSAIASTGYAFVNWTGDITTIDDSDSANTTITMNGDYSITANFIRVFTLTISSTAGGSVTLPGEGIFTFNEGTIVNLSAVASMGYTFVNWTGDITDIDDPNSANTTITMNGNYSITANFT